MEIGKVGAPQGTALIKRLRNHFQRKARVGATHIGNQARMVESLVGHVGRPLSQINSKGASLTDGNASSSASKSNA